MRRFFGTALAAALVFALPSGDAFAKGGSRSSGGFSSGSSSSSSKGFSSTPKAPSGSSSKGLNVTSPPTAQAAKPQTSSGGFSPGTQSSAPTSSGGFSPGGSPPKTVGGNGPSSKPPSGAAAAALPPAPQAAKPPSSAYDQSVNRQISSKSFEQRRAEVNNVRQSDSFKAATGGRTFTPREVETTRTRYAQERYQDRYVPQHTYDSRPFGMSDFMMNMLIYDALFAHNHRNDPDYQSWRREADERAREDKKLREQLASLDAQVKDLEGKGTPRDAKYRPKDVPPEVMYHEAALTNKVAAEKESGFSWLSLLLALAVLGGIALVVVRMNSRTRNPLAG